jgi:signal transduction histidine kinase
MLHEFLAANTQEIIARIRAEVVKRTIPTPSEEELKNGVPLFLNQLIARLRIAAHHGSDDDAIEASATQHGSELFAMGFTVGEVVHGYGDLCQVITGLAVETHAPITVDEFQTLNRCLDEAIAHAVIEYERARDASTVYEGMERLAVLAHEMRNRIAAGMLAFNCLQTGTVAIGGSTVAVLGRSLRDLRDLVNNSLAAVRLDAGLGERRRVAVNELLGELEVEASMEASAGGFKLTVARLGHGVDVEADPQILAAAIANLLQNAFRFSRKYGHVELRMSATPSRVGIEIEDECGGLAPGKIEELTHSDGRLNVNRASVGLGLFSSRKGIEAMGGQIGVRDLPGKGCIFSIDLPRMPPS